MFLILFLMPTFTVFAQKDTARDVFLSTYLETYYAYDFAKPTNQNRPNFVYSYHRHNEVSLNLGFIKTEYVSKNTRANLAFMAGTYSQTNLASEPSGLRNIFEANAGIKLSQSKHLWIDVGIFPSHIGFESAIGKDCWNASRSICADASPYYESGIKLSYKNNRKTWFLSALFLNGWQRIYRTNGNNAPAFGHQITYTPNSNILLNSSSFIGDMSSVDSIQMMRYFHNFYGQFQFTNTFGIIAGFDIGIQQKPQRYAYDVWYSPILITRYSLSQKINLAARVEYYSDPNQVMIFTGTNNGFQTYGYSLNFDYRITKNALWRVEARGFNSKDEIFTFNKKPYHQNYFIITTLSVFFQNGLF